MYQCSRITVAYFNAARIVFILHEHNSREGLIVLNLKITLLDFDPVSKVLKKGNIWKMEKCNIATPRIKYNMQ